MHHDLDVGVAYNFIRIGHLDETAFTVQIKMWLLSFVHGRGLWMSQRPITVNKAPNTPVAEAFTAEHG